MPAITKPTVYQEALNRLSGKTPVAVALASAEWATMPEEIREAAFFVANVESASMLSQLQRGLESFLAQTRERTADGSTALKVGGRADFVKRMQDWMIGNGMGDPLPGGQGRGERGLIPEITDPASNRRLKLIFDTQVRQAYGRSAMKYSLSDGVISAYPALRFVREGFVKEPREDHEKHKGEVRLKSDEEYWKARNDPKFGGFGVPYGPFGFNSQMGTEEVGRQEAIELGLIKRTDKPKGKTVRFKKGMKASVRKMDPELLGRVLRSLGDGAELVGDEIKLKE